MATGRPTAALSEASDTNRVKYRTAAKRTTMTKAVSGERKSTTPKATATPFPPPETEIDRKDVPQEHCTADQGKPVVRGRIQELPGEREGEDPFPRVEDEGQDPRPLSESARDVRRADVPGAGLPQIHVPVERLRDEDAERDGAEQVAEEDEEDAAEPRRFHGRG